MPATEGLDGDRRSKSIVIWSAEAELTPDQDTHGEMGWGAEYQDVRLEKSAEAGTEARTEAGTVAGAGAGPTDTSQRYREPLVTAHPTLALTTQPSPYSCQLQLPYLELLDGLDGDGGSLLQLLPLVTQRLKRGRGRGTSERARGGGMGDVRSQARRSGGETKQRLEGQLHTYILAASYYELLRESSNY